MCDALKRTQAKALKAREKAVVDAAKDDEDEVLRKREERDAAKRKEEKVRPALFQSQTCWQPAKMSASGCHIHDAPLQHGLAALIQLLCSWPPEQ